jgi:hypothetical protein
MIEVAANIKISRRHFLRIAKISTSGNKPRWCPISFREAAKRSTGLSANRPTWRHGHERIRQRLAVIDKPLEG